MKLFNIFALLILLVACENSNSELNGYTSADSDGRVMGETVQTAYEIAAPELPEQEQKIIKTGNLAFETQDLEKTHQKIRALAKQYKAIIQKDISGKDYNREFQEMTIRVPSKNFQQFVDQIGEGVTYFDRREISQRDVTEEFVDLEARLKAKRELEKRYLELLKKAKNVEEMLQIESELSAIREEIESKQGRLKYLQSRVSMSTINLEFYRTTADTGYTVSYGQKVKNALQGGLDGISAFFLGLLYLWPLFVIAIIGILVIRWFVRRSKKKE